MRTLDALIDAVQAEARRAPFPVDEPIYRRAAKDATRPVLYAGNPAAPLCVFGRDLGRDEVAHGQPMVGAGGGLVRRGLIAAFAPDRADPADPRQAAALDFALLTNTVPYKPPGNKAYAGGVKERFRPFLAELLAVHWAGDRVLTLGTEAFRWFAPYAEPGAADAFWAREDRYEADLPCVLTAEPPGSGPIRRPLTVCPLPHPSPLNQRWYSAFPGLLAARLRG